MVLQVVILCGGNGTRLWPLSNKNCPKQLISLQDDINLLDNTIERVKILTDLKPLLVTTKKYPLPHKYNNYPQLVEPFTNDTGVAFARIAQYYKNLNLTLLIIPSDHYINNIQNFIYDINNAWKSYNKGIILFGIKPNLPSTNYGYILINDNIIFKEKPSIEEASQLIAQGALWNSGIVLVKNDILLNNIPQEFLNVTDDKKYPSFDVSVLQKSKELNIYKTNDWQWSDIGNWNEILPLLDRPIDNKVITLDCQNTNVLNYENTEIIALGLNNILIVYKDNKLLVYNKNVDPNLLKTAIEQL
jgi:mannose-1-phosphate guanylyltransferase